MKLPPQVIGQDIILRSYNVKIYYVLKHVKACWSSMIRHTAMMVAHDRVCDGDAAFGCDSGNHGKTFSCPEVGRDRQSVTLTSAERESRDHAGVT